MHWRLVGTSGMIVGQVVPIGREVKIGRDPANHLVVTDSSVSRHHARLTMSATGPVLEDLGSANGTLVDGLPIVGGVVLTPASRVQVGQSEFRVEPVGVHTPRPVETSTVERAQMDAASVEALQLNQRPGCLLGDLLAGLTAGGNVLVRLCLCFLIFLVCLSLLGGIVRIGSSILHHMGGSASPASPGPASAPQTGPNNPGSSGQTPPPQNEGTSEDGSGIDFSDIKVVQVKRRLVSQEAHVLVFTFTNHSGHSVSSIQANVQMFDAEGKDSILVPYAVIYKGAPVPDGGTGTSTAETGAIVSIAKLPEHPPVSAKLDEVSSN